MAVWRFDQIPVSYRDQKNLRGGHPQLFHLAHISDSGVSRRVDLLDFEGWGLH